MTCMEMLSKLLGVLWEESAGQKCSPFPNGPVMRTLNFGLCVMLVWKNGWSNGRVVGDFIRQQDPASLITSTCYSFVNAFEGIIKLQNILSKLGVYFVPETTNRWLRIALRHGNRSPHSYPCFGAFQCPSSRSRKNDRFFFADDIFG